MVYLVAVETGWYALRANQCVLQTSWRKGKQVPVIARFREPAPPRIELRRATDQAAVTLSGFAVDFQLNLDTETVEHCHPSKSLCAQSTDSVRTVLRMLQEARTGAAMICTDGKLKGIFTERDALRLLADGANLDMPVSEVMIRNPVTVRKTDTVAKAISLMSGGGFRRLPIVDDQGLVQGILKVSSLLHYLVEHFPKIVHTLPPAPHYKSADREGA
jgi:signal-transduction protein with cAMP-binding, CBS, and nucleotidyltransferase domain